MQFRLAKLADHKALSRVALRCAAGDSEGFTFRLGRRFFDEFYRTVLRETSTVVTCAVDDHTNEIVGFVAGTLDAGEWLTALRRNKFKLAIATLTAVVRNPRGVLPGLWSRYRSTQGMDDNYVINKGAYCNYWGVVLEARVGNSALLLMQKWLGIMRLLGAEEIALEVDEENPRIEQVHRRLGAVVKRSIVTPDGKRRKQLIYPC